MKNVIPGGSRPPAVVVDTNLFVSGTIIKHGLPFALLEAWRSRLFILLLSDDQQAEIEDMLNRPEIADRYHLSKDERAHLFFLLEATARRVTPQNPLPVQVRDANDEMVLAAALGGKADYLVTGDDDLLVVRDRPELGSVRIVTAREFLDALVERRERQG